MFTKTEYDFLGTNTTLTGVVFPEGLQSIGSDAFVRCKALTSVEIPASLTRLGSYCFAYGALTEIRYGGTMAEWEAVEKGKQWDFRNEGGSYTVFCTDGEITVEIETKG